MYLKLATDPPSAVAVAVGAGAAGAARDSKGNVPAYNVHTVGVTAAWILRSKAFAAIGAVTMK